MNYQQWVDEQSRRLDEAIKKAWTKPEDVNTQQEEPEANKTPKFA